MLHNFFSLTHVFRIVNFAVFIGIVVYLYKRYLLPSVLQQIQQKKLLLQNLENQKQGIKYQMSNIEQAVAQQEHIAQEITKKIDQWNAYVAQKNEEKRQEESALQATIKKRMHAKSTEIALENLKNTLIPEPLANVEQELREKFSSGKQADQYAQEIITHLKESTP